MLDPTIPLRFMVKRFRCRQLIPERTPLTLFAPAPPTVSYVVCDHLSPAGPAPYPCPGVDRPLRGKLPVVQHRCSSHFRFMVKHFRPFLLKPYHPASPQPSFFASWSSVFGPFCSSPTTLLLLSPLFLLHGQAFSALSAQAPTKKTWGYDVFGLFCFIMKSKNSQPKPAISIFAAGNCQRYESRYEKHQAPTQ